MGPEPVTAEPPRAVRPVVLRQSWRDVAFVHWAVDPGAAAPLLPPGTRPDTLDGRTFVGLVALRMLRTAPLGGPSIPWLGTFGQVNVRLYSVDDEGRRGVVFLSLDADRLVPAAAARTAGLPYAWARVQVAGGGSEGRRTYDMRRHAGAVTAHLSLRIGARREPSTLERFVTERWGLHHRVLGRTVYTAVAHPPWRLHAARAEELHTNLLVADGLPDDVGAPVSVLWSPRVDGVQVGPPAL